MIGKLGLLQGIFMILFGMIPTMFALIFVGMPLFFVTMIFDMGIHWEEHENLLDDLSWVYWIIGGFFLLTLVLALLKILLKGKEEFKLSLYKNDATYMRKTFSSSGSHSFGSSSGSSFGSSTSSAYKSAMRAQLLCAIRPSYATKGVFKVIRQNGKLSALDYSPFGSPSFIAHRTDFGYSGFLSSANISSNVSLWPSGSMDFR